MTVEELSHSSLLVALQAFHYAQLLQGPTAAFQSGWGLQLDWATAPSSFFSAILL